MLRIFRLWIQMVKSIHWVKIREVLLCSNGLIPAVLSLRSIIRVTICRNFRKNILRKNPFIHSTVVFRKNVLEKDPYKVENYLLEDYALWLKLGLIGKFINLDEYTTEYLINPDGETQTKNLRQTINSFKTIKNYKKQYPNYFQSYIFWILKIILRKLLLNLK